MIGDADLLKLTAGRWLLPLMAHLDASGGGTRFAAMLAQLGLSRSVLAASLAQLQEAGWLARNAGHGHPLRPEYVLTGRGIPVAAFAARIMEERRRLGLEPVQMPRWSLPVIARIGGGESRFSAIRSSLAPVTPRALSQTLKQMLMLDLVDRSLETGFPPATAYALTGRGESLAEAMR